MGFSSEQGLRPCFLQMLPTISPRNGPGKRPALAPPAGTASEPRPAPPSAAPAVGTPREMRLFLLFSFVFRPNTASGPGEQGGGRYDPPSPADGLWVSAAGSPAGTAAPPGAAG